MSKHSLSKEGAIDQLYSTIKTKLEQDGILQDMRCMLQSKIVGMMHGKDDKAENAYLQRCAIGGSKMAGHAAGKEKEAGGPLCSRRDPRMQLLHQLIMEYFHWHGFYYSAEMFAMESGNANEEPMRECLEGVLGTFEGQDVPILLELVANAMDQKKYTDCNSQED